MVESLPSVVSTEAGTAVGGAESAARPSPPSPSTLLICGTKALNPEKQRGHFLLS